MSLDKLEQQFNDFQTAYTKNGKELVRLGTLLETHLSAQEIQNKEVNKRLDKMQPILEAFQGMKFTRWVVIATATFITIVGSAIVMVKKLL